MTSFLGDQDWEFAAELFCIGLASGQMDDCLATAAAVDTRGAIGAAESQSLPSRVKWECVWNCVKKSMASKSLERYGMLCARYLATHPVRVLPVLCDSVSALCEPCTNF